MGRPRLYHTPEEKQIANRLKSKKYYEKNKARINRVRRKGSPAVNEYISADNSLALTTDSAHISLNETTATENTKSRVKPTTLADWLERANRIPRRLKRLLGDQDVTTFMDEICHALRPIAERSRESAKEYLDGQLSPFSRLLKTNETYKDRVVDLVGYGAEWETVSTNGNRIREVIDFLEDIYCSVLVDPPNVQEQFLSKSFLYQLK